MREYTQHQESFDTLRAENLVLFARMITVLQNNIMTRDAYIGKMEH